MEAKELRIGNLVDYDGFHYRVSGISQTFNGEPYNVELKDSNGMFQEVPIEELEPIPLTEEWLLRFGFETEYTDDGIPFFSLKLKDDKYCDLSFLSGDKNGFMEVGLFPYNDFFRFKHVHEIQNLYFCLVGLDLKIK